MCANRLNTKNLITFTSYKVRPGYTDLYENATIVQACLATSAAPTYFDPVEITLGPPNGRYYAQFVDGALGYNNPVSQLWNQANLVYGGPIGGRVDCLISVGTGEPAAPDYTSSAKDLFKMLQELATECKKTAEEFYANHKYDLGRQKYFRSNVDHGSENIDLGEAKQTSRIIELTKNYLSVGRVYDEIEDCTAILAARECPSIFA